MTDCFSHELVIQSKVMVVGCGALGNEVLKNLALMDVRNIVIVDFDMVEAANLSRSCLFSIVKGSVGRPKVEVAKEALDVLNPELDLIVINGDFCYDVGLSFLQEMDIVISCVDNRWTRFIINRYCQAVGIPWIDGGISSLEGSVKAFGPGKDCYACLIGNNKIEELAQRFSCPGTIRRAIQSGHAPTNSIVASIIGAIIVQETLKIITNTKTETQLFQTLEGKILSYDGFHTSLSISSFQAFDEECCEHLLIKDNFDVKIKSDDTLLHSLDKIKKHFGAENIEIILERTPFVSSIIDISENKEYVVKLPAHKVEEYVNNNPETSGIPFGYFRQKEFWIIDEDFPYMDLSLRNLGIPSNDLLKIYIDGKECHINVV